MKILKKNSYLLTLGFLTAGSAWLHFNFAGPWNSKNSEDRLLSGINKTDLKQSKQLSSQSSVEASIRPAPETQLEKSKEPLSDLSELHQNALAQKREFYGGSFTEQELQQKLAELDQEMEPLIAKVNREALKSTADADSLRLQLTRLMGERNAIGLALADLQLRNLRRELAADN